MAPLSLLPDKGKRIHAQSTCPLDGVHFWKGSISSSWSVKVQRRVFLLDIIYFFFFFIHTNNMFTTLHTSATQWRDLPPFSVPKASRRLQPVSYLRENGIKNRRRSCVHRGLAFCRFSLGRGRAFRRFPLGRQVFAVGERHKVFGQNQRGRKIKWSPTLPAARRKHGDGKRWGEGVVDVNGLCTRRALM